MVKNVVYIVKAITSNQKENDRLIARIERAGGNNCKVRRLRDNFVVGTAVYSIETERENYRKLVDTIERDNTGAAQAFLFETSSAADIDNYIESNWSKIASKFSAINLAFYKDEYVKIYDGKTFGIKMQKWINKKTYDCYFIICRGKRSRFERI